MTLTRAWTHVCKATVKVQDLLHVELERLFWDGFDHVVHQASVRGMGFLPLNNKSLNKNMESTPATRDESEYEEEEAEQGNEKENE